MAGIFENLSFKEVIRELVDLLFEKFLFTISSDDAGSIVSLREVGVELFGHFSSYVVNRSFAFNGVILESV